MIYPGPVARLIEELTKLPGVGPKTAQRLAFHILETDAGDVQRLAESLLSVRSQILNCSVCHNITDVDPCRLCRNPERDRQLVCVVEGPRDVAALERSHEYRGLYHVLHGAWSPMEGVGLEKLRVKELVERIKMGEISEVIIATNPDLEGEATAMYLSRLLKPLDVKVTRIAHGLPVGGELDYAADDTIARALQGRREM
ncbi:MAG: recombination mediator RecR [Bacillota bacterium]